MKKTNIIIFILLMCNFTVSYASESTVVFMRSSFVGSMIKASIYEVTEEETKFIGILKNKSKIIYKTSPGKHTFMVVSEAADFMEANIAEDKTYYSIITPRTGAWKARFSMVPVTTDGSTKFNLNGKKFNKIKKKTNVVEMNEKSLKWYEKHKENVEKKKAKYWKKWQTKSSDDVAQRTLNPEDGI